MKPPHLQRYGSGYRALVFGASGGIGRAFLAHLKADPNCGAVKALSRNCVGHTSFDLTDEYSIEAAAHAVKADGPWHLMIDATGLLHADTLQPEKSLAVVSAEHLDTVFAVNATGPLLLLKHFSPQLVVGSPSTFVTLSARVGSISDNRLGGWYGYRAAKAALNMFVKTAAIEVARRRPLAVIAGMHPGTVRTALSDPFAGTRELFEPKIAAARMLEVVDALEPEQSGGLFAYDGTQIPW